MFSRSAILLLKPLLFILTTNTTTLSFRRTWIIGFLLMPESKFAELKIRLEDVSMLREFGDLTKTGSQAEGDATTTKRPRMRLKDHYQDCVKDRDMSIESGWAFCYVRLRNQKMHRCFYLPKEISKQYPAQTSQANSLLTTPLLIHTSYIP